MSRSHVEENMKEIVNIYKSNRQEIKKHIFKTINELQREPLTKESLRSYFPMFSSLQNIYIVDKEFTQITPLYSKTLEDNQKIDKTITSLKENVTFDENGEYISSSYISRSDGNPTITVAKKVNENEILILNFNLAKLLDELNYTSKTNFFNSMTKFIYAAIGYSLSLFAVILIFYSLFNFAYHITDDDINIFQSIFKSTIALTLGLAIFDLAKNLLEHEVVYKEHFNGHDDNKKLLEKFLISIIIALSIEALMTVFKIALSDYKDILYAVYLILAISVMIFALSYFNKTSK